MIDADFQTRTLAGVNAVEKEENTVWSGSAMKSAVNGLIAKSEWLTKSNSNT